MRPLTGSPKKIIVTAMLAAAIPQPS